MFIIELIAFPPCLASLEKTYIIYHTCIYLQLLYVILTTVSIALENNDQVLARYYQCWYKAN